MKTIHQDALPKRERPTTDPFREFHPVLWCPQAGSSDTGAMIYSIKRNHGVQGTYRLIE